MTPTAATSRAALSVSPSAYPSARAAGVPLGPVRCWATVPRAASPSDAPIWRELVSRPDAVPLSCGATPAVAVATTGPRQSPKPRPATSEGPRTSVAKEPSGPRPRLPGLLPGRQLTARLTSSSILFASASDSSVTA